jgi:hypothetical protein
MVMLNGVSFDVAPGDFLLASVPQYGSRVVVCEVATISSVNVLSVYCWVEDYLLADLIVEDPRQPLLQSAYTNAYKCRVREVTKVWSNVIELNASCLQDIAFVFHVEDLEKRYINCAGMKSVFFTRFELHVHGTLHEVRYQSHQPFNTSLVRECYPSRIWHSLIYLKDRMAMLMNKRRQQQVCRNSVSVFFSLESWQYLCRQYASVVEPVLYQKAQSKPYYFCDLSIDRQTHVATLAMLRIACQSSMERSREIFGVTFAIGCRNMPPLKGEEKRQLLYGDLVNIVNVNDNDLASIAGRRFREVVALQSIDFVYDNLSRLLSIRVRYSKVLAQAAVVRDVLHVSVAEPQVRGNMQRRRAIALGTAFLLDGSLVKVMSSNVEYVTVKDVSSGAERTLETNVARALIMQHIGFG